MRLKVNVIGVINDQKFTTRGTGAVDPDTGLCSIRLTYSRVPEMWHIYNYSDPLVLLAGYREEGGGLNFMSMCHGGYSSESTIDFGAGMSLRKTASIRWEGCYIHADYAIVGSARVDDITGIEPYEEFMHPAGDGQIIAVGLARWQTTSRGIIEAVVSSRYKFIEHKEVLKIPQVRSFKVKPTISPDGLTYEGEYETVVKPL
jgi:hypothetical protein